MSKGNLARKQIAAVPQIAAFAARVAADPERFGIAPALSTDLSAAAAALTDAYKLVFPTIRNRSTVSAKDDAFAIAENLYRRVYSQIKWNGDLSDFDKINVGVRPVNRTRTKQKLPLDPPQIGIRMGLYGQHIAVYWHSCVREGVCCKEGGKPPAASQLQLFVAIEDTPVYDHTLARICGCYTRNNCVVNFQPKDGGKFASYFGRWVSTRGDTGAFSAPVSMRIAA